MTSLKIVSYPHPALRHVAQPLTAIDRSVRLYAAKMLELMYAARGIGLAANQVAWPYQMFVVNTTADPQQTDQELVLINPVIMERKGSVEGEEGCLSFPNLYQKIRRAKTVKVQAYNLAGQQIEIVTNDFPARVLQHEIDHLHGILFIDKMGPVAKLASRSALKDFERDFLRALERGEAPSTAEWEKRSAILEVNPFPIKPFRIVMMGTGTFAEPTFKALFEGPHTVVGLVTQPDREAGQERGSTRQVGQGMKLIAQERHLPVLQPESINTPEAIAALRELKPDLLVVAAYGQILSKDVLAVAPEGGINVHASLLPKYRGAAPIAWAIVHGETRTGVTIIRMSTALDAGDMLAQEAVDIGAEETTGELEARLAPLGAGLAMQVIEQMAIGATRGVQQDVTQVTKAPKLKKQHGQIDWTRHGQEICNHIRAMQPWPTAYTYLYQEGKPPIRLMINKAVWHESEASQTQPPGNILAGPGSSSSLRVSAGDGSVVEILELQPAGKRRMPAADFLRGHAARVGDHLGPESA